MLRAGDVTGVRESRALLGCRVQLLGVVLCGAGSLADADAGSTKEKSSWGESSSELLC